MDAIGFFESILGKNAVLSDSQKDHYGKDYTKNFTIKTLCAVFPQTTKHVQDILKYCYENKIAVVPSGGRTGLSGAANATQNEVVLSLEKMNKLIQINKTDRTLRCQGGMVTKEVQKLAEENGFYFPVDFASSGSSHIAGNIATNAGGIKVIRYGLMRDWVAGIQVVLPNGELLEMTNVSVKNNTGYDLKHLFIGSEGTLGVITECVLKLTSPPGELITALFALNSLENVTGLFSLAREEKLPLSAFEFFTTEALAKVQEHTHKKSPFAESHSHYVLMEVEKGEGGESALEKFVEIASEKNLITDGVLASNSVQSQDFWALRENISESLSQTSTVHKNDISLPISQIADFCKNLDLLLKEKYSGFEAVLFGHIGDGNLHVNFVKPKSMSSDDFFSHAKKADTGMFDLVKKYGGSISAEHGIGLTKKAFLSYTRSPLEISLMKQIKKVFDPQHIMNPGKIFD